MIQISNLTKQYGKEIILKDINITFEDGHIYGLVGPNGCGKTTLMRCICGFSHPNNGRIIVNKKLIGKECDFPHDTGIILESPSFLPQYTGLKNLLILAGVSQKISKTHIISTMEMVGLDPSCSKEVKKYSLGMRQRLGIAQAIMENPSVLILDEPFNGLDRQGVIDIHALLQEEKKKKKTIILASHNVFDVIKACDEVYELIDGQIRKINQASLFHYNSTYESIID